MSTGNPLEQLRRRMQSHATPTAFAALAEEHRRAGRFDEAIAVCRDGLARYPAYVSARVTLGRALLDSGEVTAALAELQQAVAQAPDNLAAARALESAHTALGNAPPPPLAPDPAAADLPLCVASDDVASIPDGVVAQALISGADGPHEFGLAPDWSIPDPPADAAPEGGATAAEPVDDDNQAILGHAEAPTMYISPPHLQGEEPAGIWPVPGSGPVTAHDAPDAARVFSWAIDPPPGEEPAESPARGTSVIPPPVSLWDEPTIEAPLADLLGAPADEAGTGYSPDVAAHAEHELVAFEPFGTGSLEVEASALSADLSFEAASDEGVESAAVAEATGDALAVTSDEQAPPFWSGTFGGEPRGDTSTPFVGWGEEPPPQDAGADRSPWSDATPADSSGSWAVPDGPSAAWALGDLHEASGADASPFAGGRDGAPEIPVPTPLVEPALAAAEPVAAPLADMAWEGSVKSALGEVFARAGHGESLEPPTHASRVVRTAMADAAVEAAIEDAVLRDDAPAPALATLQQMLDSVRARRAALVGDHGQ